MRKQAALLFSVFLAIGSTALQASAATITNSFDSDAQGWTGNPGEGSLAWVASGGNLGGHIRITDIGGGINNGFASGALAGADFLGDLSAFNGGMLSLDMATFAGGGGTFPSFGNLRVEGGGLVANVDVAANAPIGGWQSYSATFDAATWGVSEADWTTILSNVTLFGVPTDAFDGGDTIGIDNVTLASKQMSPVPLPAGMLLLLSGLIGIGAIKRLGLKSDL
ncbi:VPLPA-CTERM sorting domain-containing protein [Roseobacter sp. EG26]|uniref:VPLPA-CTERM sorting domain-containing protein n=1 Tax=Roseobacter sp. EG26 TaxID=3412477 RepID=UPI003CE4C1F9